MGPQNAAKAKLRFKCEHPACGRSYSRAEHLQRHRLNHYPDEIYTCQHPECLRTFVRWDLFMRHRERHGTGHRASAHQVVASHDHLPAPNLRNSDEIDKDGSLSILSVDPRRVRKSSGMLSAQLSPFDSSMQLPPDVLAGKSPIHSSDPSTPKIQGRPEGLGSSSANTARESRQDMHPTPLLNPTIQISSAMEPYGTPENALSQDINNQQTEDFPESAFGSLQSPDSAHAGVQATSSPGALEGMHQLMGNGDFTGFHISTLPMQAAEGVAEATRHNLSSWLLDGMASYQPAYLPLHMQTSLGQATINVDSFMPPEPPEWVEPHPPQADRHNLEDSQSNFMRTMIDDAAGISQTKWLELVSLIEKRFNGSDNVYINQIRGRIFNGSVYVEDHPLSLQSLRGYVSAYFHHFHPQLPILHQPTFSADHAHEYMLLAVMMIGTSYPDTSNGQMQRDDAVQLGVFIAWHLRWQVFMHTDFQPPAKLWVLQTLLLLEFYDKTNGPRIMHQRGHLMYATTVNLMRRGTALFELVNEDTCRTTTSPNEWWSRWISAEATRRVAFGAFYLDTINATLFGHPATMVVHEIRLPLPCDDALWSATSPTEVARIQASLHANGIKPTMFLAGLNRLFSGKRARTNHFGRIMLMAGLMSLSWHMNQRDLQISSLGIDQAMGNTQWRGALSKAMDFWKEDFDDHMEHVQKATLPWQHGESTAGNEVVRNTAELLFHLSHINIHVELYEHQIFVGLKRVLGRTVSSEDIRRVRQKFSGWARKPGSSTAAFHALKVLRDIVYSSEQYDACKDTILLRPWYVYIAATTFWSYCHSLNSSLPTSEGSLTEDGNSKDTTIEPEGHALQKFLSFANAIKSPRDLETFNARINLSPVLSLLATSFSDSKWELLREAGKLLQETLTLPKQANGPIN